MKSIDIGLTEKQRGAVSAFLNGLLADLHVYWTKLHNLHWNVVGMNFFSLHAKLEEMYDQANEELDEVAERILMLGMRPLAQVNDFLKKSSIKELDSKDWAASEVVPIVLEDMAYFLGQYRKGITIAQENGDEGSADMLIGYLSRSEKTAWMWRSMS